MRKMIFSDRVMNIFSDMNTDHESMTNLMVDVAVGREMFDAESRTIISKAAANAKILEFSQKVLGIVDPSDKKQVRRALRDHGREFLDVIEDALDQVAEYGFTGNEWFNSMVEEKVINVDDEQDFTVTEDCLLSVVKAGDNHYDHIMQRIGKETTYTIPTDMYVVKVGADLQKYAVGQVDWVSFVNAAAKALVVKTQEILFAEVAAATSVLPIQDTRFIQTGTLTKANLDAIISNVADANGITARDVVIMGSTTALKALGSVVTVDYISNTQKENVTATGIIGIYDGSELVELPNRFKDKALTQRILPTNELYIMPKVDGEKMFKLVLQGGTEIVEKESPSDYTSTLKSYEIHKRIGAGTVFTRYFGKYTM